VTGSTKKHNEKGSLATMSKKEQMEELKEHQNDASEDMESKKEEVTDTTDSDDTESLLAQKEEELKECEDKVLRLAAELDNFKKRIEREKDEHMKYALEAFAKDLLPFLDNLERAIDAAKESGDADKLIEGIELSLSGYFKVMEKFGLKVFDSEGQPFDPEKHEALTVEATDDFEHNTVIKELLRGYTLHDRILRPAMVVVAKNK
jgi:molecular chaperone GrpE